MKIQALLGNAFALALLIGAENLNAMKKATGTGGKETENNSPQVTTPPAKLEEVPVQVSTGPQKREDVPQDNKGAPNQTYTWGAYFTNTYFAWTANTTYEKQKFPEVSPSGVLKHMDSTTTLDGARKIAFKFTTGSSVSAPDYYNGMAFLDEIDYGNYSVQFLGAEKGFSPHPTYISLTPEIQPYQFINEYFIKAKCDGVMCKGDLIKGTDTKTRMVYVLHNEKDNKYLRIVLRREQ